eukprot:6486460-Amphidinium_carterae.1
MHLIDGSVSGRRRGSRGHAADAILGRFCCSWRQHWACVCLDKPISGRHLTSPHKTHRRCTSARCGLLVSP